MAPGVGIDLLEIDRLERALDRHPRLADRIFSDQERRYAAARSRPARHLAARFAAKEAVLKAIEAPGPLGLGEVEVVGSKPPSVRLRGRAAAAAGDRRVSVSLTHSRDFAAAVAIVEPG